MTVHLIKLCVGAEDMDDLVAWQMRLMRQHPKPFHHTRMVPKRAAELIQGGSIYWVIRGMILARQAIIEVNEFIDRGERKACELVFDPAIIAVQPTPKRAFQGWRYLKPEDAPPDQKLSSTGQDMPTALQAELRAALVW